METQYTKTDEFTLTETKTTQPEQKEPEVVTQNYSLEYLQIEKRELKEKKLAVINQALDSVAKIDEELQVNAARLQKAKDLGIKSKEAQVDAEIVDKETSLNEKAEVK
jgi:hypothetical protein